jgi:hypothetical protein
MVCMVTFVFKKKLGKYLYKCNYIKADEGGDME